MTNADDIPVVLVLSAWGSGSTSVAGFLDKCGGYTCPPHVMTYDEKTPNAYEPEALRAVLNLCIDETTFEPKGNAKAFVRFFSTWIAEQKELAAKAGHSVIVLKHPLLVFLLPALVKMVLCKVVVVTRPLDAIERTRQRRNWHPTFGKAGAQIIYARAEAYLRELDLSYLCIAYGQFRENTELRHQLLRFTGLNPDDKMLANANAWLR